MGAAEKVGECMKMVPHSEDSACSCCTLLDSGRPRRDTGGCRGMPVPSPTVGAGEAWPGLDQSLPGEGKVMLWGEGQQQPPVLG